MLKHIKTISLLLFSIVIFGACDQTHKTDDGIIVRVFDKSLSEKDLDENFQGQLNDTILRKQYIQQWIRSQIISETARAKVKSNEKIERLTEDYKNALLVNNFEEQFLAERLSKEVSEESIQDYFDENMSDFSNHEIQLQVYLAKIPDDDPGVSLFKEWWSVDNLDELKRFCNDHNFLCLLDKEKWYTREEIEVLLPGSIHKALEKGKNLNQKKDKFEYFVKTFDNRSKSSEASLQLHRETIVQRVLFARKQQLLNHLRDSLYHDAIEKNKVKLNIDD